MSDNKEIRGGEDRTRVAGVEKWEIEHLVNQTGASRKEIAEAIKAVGNDMDKIEEYLRNRRVF